MAGPDVGLEVIYNGKRFREAESGLRAFAQDMNRAPERAAPALRAEIESYLTAIARVMETRHSAPWHPGASDSMRLFRRSGALVKAIRESVNVSGQKLENIEGRIGASLLYAAIQEYGGTIYPKLAKYLAIPLPSALTAQGLPILPSPRDWISTFVATSKAGNLLIFQKQSNGRIIPLYVLKSKVTIPARLGMGDELRTGLGAFTDQAMNAMLHAIVSHN